MAADFIIYSYSNLKVQAADDTIMTDLIELLGEQLIQHNTDASTGTYQYIATSELEGKIIGLFFA